MTYGIMNYNRKQILYNNKINRKRASGYRFAVH